MVETAKHYTIDDLDSQGRALVGHNKVLAVCYYNSLEDEAWTRDHSVPTVNPFVNSDFSAPTVTGTGPYDTPGPGWYEKGEVPLASPSFFYRNKIAFYWEEDLFSEYGTRVYATSTAAGAAGPDEVLGDWGINASAYTTPPRNIFPINYWDNYDPAESWATSSGIPGTSPGPGEYVIELDPPQEVAGFYLHSYDIVGLSREQGVAGTIGDYEIQVAASGVDYTSASFMPVVSGTSPYGYTEPVWREVSPTLAKYVKLKFWAVSAAAPRAQLRKFYCFSQETVDKGVAANLARVAGFGTLLSNGYTWSLQQDVDLSGVDTLYLEYKDYTDISGYKTAFYIDAVKVFEIQLTRTFTGGYNNTGSFIQVRGASLDVSAYSGTHNFEIRRFIRDTWSSYFAINEISTVPSWYTEEASPERAATAAFPSEVVFSVDRAGMSIIDVTPNVTGLPDPQLWMRFILGPRKMLSKLPRKVVGYKGRFYLATTGATYLLDFPGNRMVRWDHRGVWYRYGIDLRNLDEHGTQEQRLSPFRTLHGFQRIHTTRISMPQNIHDLAASTADGFGDFVVFGTSQGLVLWDSVLGETLTYYVSKDKRPVKHVSYNEGKLWYTQGIGGDTTICFVDDVNTIASADFEPDAVYHQTRDISATLSGSIDSKLWEVLNDDSAMAITQGDVVTLSGSHLYGGMTGIRSKFTFADRDFTAKVKVRLLDFSPDAIGAFRFGFSSDYDFQGNRSLRYNHPNSDLRPGVFISALNTDPIGGWLAEDVLLTVGSDRRRGWCFVKQDRNSSFSGSQRSSKAISFEDDGLEIQFLDRFDFNTIANLIRAVTAWAIRSRDFTATVDFYPQVGFVPSSSRSSAPWLGTTTKKQFVIVPGENGSYVDTAMVAAGNTTFSGTLVYTAGSVNSSALTAAVLDHSTVIPFEAGEGDGSEGFRTWRIEYDAAQGTIDAYIDDQHCGTQKGGATTQPPMFALTFGINGDTSTYMAPLLEGTFNNFHVVYPPIHAQTSHKYSIEVSDGFGGFRHPLAHFTTYSGVQLVDDLSPASSTLPGLSALSDGSLAGGGYVVVTDGSFGVALSGTRTVDAVYIYDAQNTTDGWSNTNDKELELWLSDDNQAWTRRRTYDLNKVERTAGVTKINFTPALDSKFFKFKVMDSLSDYAVPPSSSTWNISEVRAMTMSGIDFFPTDASALAEFHEWRLDFDATTRIATAYIDDNFVSETTVADSLDGSQLYLVHDLVPVTSGINTFHAEFKEIEVTFPEGPSFAPGEITGLSVNTNATSGGRFNHTVLTSTSAGLGVTDIEIGAGATLPTTFQFFEADEHYFGDSNLARSLFADDQAQRNVGLVFVGTAELPPAYYAQRYAKPQWLERNTDPESGIENLYGGMPTYVYHPGLDRVVQTIGRNSGYFSLLDLDRGQWDPLPRGRFAQTYGVPRDTQRDTAKGAYSSFDDKIWYLFDYNILVGSTMATCESSRLVLTNTDIIDGLGGHYYITYVMHKNCLVFGQSYLLLMDVENVSAVGQARYWGSDSKYRWNRGAILPWDNPGDGDEGGPVQAVYADFNRQVYFFGTSSSSRLSPLYFYRYDVDKDYLEEISSVNINTLQWPYTEAERLAKDVTPLDTKTKGVWLAYDPVNRRIYASSAYKTEPALYYYDIIDEEWVYTGEPPATISVKGWPDTISDWGHDSNNMVYRGKNHSLVFFGRPDDPEMFEYLLPKDDRLPKLDYLPSRDGLPTTSGVHYQYTVGGDHAAISSRYSSLADWDRDFLFSSTENSAHWDYTFSGGVVTISGNNPGAVNDVVRDRYISTFSFSSERSFDVSAKVALPKFTQSIYDPDNIDYWRAHAFFSIGICDGFNPVWRKNTWGEQSPYIYQEAFARTGVSGVASDASTDYPLRTHYYYTDSQHSTSFSLQDHVPVPISDSYLEGGGLDWGAPSSDFREVRLQYEYETDNLAVFLDGQAAGNTTLKRKFNPEGTRLFIEAWSKSENDVANDHQWVIQLKDLKVTPMAWDRVEEGRLVTSISGSVGSYYHEKWDQTITPIVDWVYEIETYLSTNTRFAGFDYIASLAAVGDGNKLAELVAFIGPGQKKQVAFTGALEGRHDRSTYLGTIDYEWDSRDIGKYRLVRDVAAGTVSLFTDEDAAPAVVLAYDDLPAYSYRHSYYGKVNYGTSFETIVGPTTLSGSWADAVNLSGIWDPGMGKRRWMNSADFAKFETINEVSPLSEAVYELPPDLGVVDLYTFYVATGRDYAKWTPHTVVASGIVALPSSVGDGETIFGIDTNTDQYGNFDSTATTVKVDQRRTFLGNTTPLDKYKLEGSGWVYLGTYDNPSAMVVTPDAPAGNSSASVTHAVCAGALGVDVGKRGRSTFDMSVGRVMYFVGRTDIPEAPEEYSGITVIDLEDKRRIDFYGETEPPELQDSDITSGDKLE